MTHDELIAKAREHAAVFERGVTFDTRVSELPDVRVREAAIVYFRGSDRDDCIEIFLDRESGDFITATYIPPKQKGTDKT